MDLLSGQFWVPNLVSYIFVYRYIGLELNTHKLIPRIRGTEYLSIYLCLIFYSCKFVCLSLIDIQSTRLAWFFLSDLICLSVCQFFVHPISSHNFKFFIFLFFSKPLQCLHKHLSISVCRECSGGMCPPPKKRVVSAPTEGWKNPAMKNSLIRPFFNVPIIFNLHFYTFIIYLFVYFIFIS